MMRAKLEKAKSMRWFFFFLPGCISRSIITRDISGSLKYDSPNKRWFLRRLYYSASAWSIIPYSPYFRRLIVGSFQLKLVFPNCCVQRLRSSYWNRTRSSHQNQEVVTSKVGTSGYLCPLAGELYPSHYGSISEYLWLVFKFISKSSWSFTVSPCFFCRHTDHHWMDSFLRHL